MRPCDHKLLNRTASSNYNTVWVQPEPTFLHNRHGKYVLLFWGQMSLSSSRRTILPSDCLALPCPFS